MCAPATPQESCDLAATRALAYPSNASRLGALPEPYYGGPRLVFQPEPGPAALPSQIIKSVVVSAGAVRHDFPAAGCFSRRTECVMRDTLKGPASRLEVSSHILKSVPPSYVTDSRRRRR